MLSRRCGAILTSIFLLVFVVLIYRINNDKPLFINFPTELEELPNILNARIKPEPEKDIFFLETSKITLKSNLSNNLVSLNARQACSVESTALHNPSAKIFLVFVSSGNKLSIDKNNGFMKSISSYDNVYIRHMNIGSFVEDTPVQEWLKNGKLFQSKFLTEDSADLIRLLILWRYGGTYLDLDVISLRSLKELPSNYVGRHNDGINNAVINSDMHGIGHQFISEFINEFQSNYNGNVWASNGPLLLRKVFLQHCALSVQYENGCKGFTIYPPETFYPIFWKTWKDYFEADQLNSTLKKITNSYLIHVWYDVSKYYKVERSENPNTAYAYLAKANCPLVYNSVEGRYI